MTDSPQAENLSGTQIGDYEILNLIGYGGMATVYRARQKGTRIVALKVLPRQFMRDDTYMQRFSREVEIVSQLEHRSIVPVHDYGEHAGQPYIVMRFMPAGSIDDLLRDGPLDTESILKIVGEIAPALDYAHSKGVLHRDLKPSNILLDENHDAYLTDFGIARMLGENEGGISITTRNVVGTPAYMSPEQAQGKTLDSRSDIYALGVMLFEMCTGQRPFQAETPYGVAVLQVTAPTPSACAINPKVSLQVEVVINKAMHKNPEQRYRSGEAMAKALRQALGASIFDTQPGMSHPTRPVELRTTRPIVNHAAPALTPPPPYTSPRTPPASRRLYRPRRRSNLWMSAAVGAIIGCGLLTALVIILVVVSSNTPPPTSQDASLTTTPAVQETIPAALDPTSEAARNALLGGTPDNPD